MNICSFLNLVRASDMTNKISPRFAGLDIARALAIFGMAFVHVIVVLSGEQVANSDFAYAFDWFSGRPAAMFMVLAGIGVSMAIKRQQGNANNVLSDVFLRRGLFFLLFGLVNLIMWEGDILRVYGIAYLLCAVFLSATTTRLWSLAVFFVFGFVLLNLFLDFETNWNFETLEYYNLWSLQGSVMNLFFNGFRAAFPWLGLFFIGMLVGRQDLTDSARLKRLFIIGTSLVIVTEGISYMMLQGALPLVEEQEKEVVIALLGTLSLPPMPLFVVSAAAFAIAVIAACNLAFNTRHNWFTDALASVGRLAFTWYILHIVIILLLAELAPANGIDLVNAWIIWEVLCLALIAISVLLTRHYKSGPLEWLLREVSRKKQEAR